MLNCSDIQVVEAHMKMLQQLEPGSKEHQAITGQLNINAGVFVPSTFERTDSHGESTESPSSKKKKIKRKKSTPANRCVLSRLVGEFFITRSCFGDALEVLSRALQLAAMANAPQLQRDAHYDMAKLLHYEMNESEVMPAHYVESSLIAAVLQAYRHYQMALSLNQDCMLHKKPVLWIAETNMQIAHLALINTPQTSNANHRKCCSTSTRGGLLTVCFGRELEQERSGQVRLLVQESWSVYNTDPDSRQALHQKIVHVEGMLAGMEAKHDRCWHKSDLWCDRCNKLRRQRELLEQEYAQLVQLHGAVHADLASVQNALAGLPCLQCLKETHYQKKKTGSKGRGQSKRTIKSSNSSQALNSLEWAAAAEEPLGRIASINTDWGTSVCSECAVHRSELYKKALHTRQQLGGKTHCLVATTLFHWGKLKLDIHELRTRHGLDSDQLLEALGLFRDAIELRERAFKDVPSAQYLITVSVSCCIFS